MYRRAAPGLSESNAICAALCSWNCADCSTSCAGVMLQGAGHAWAHKLAVPCVSHSMKAVRAPQKPLTLRQGAFLARSLGLRLTCPPLCAYTPPQTQCHRWASTQICLVPAWQPRPAHHLVTLALLREQRHLAEQRAASRYLGHILQLTQAHLSAPALLLMEALLHLTHTGLQLLAPVSPVAPLQAASQRQAGCTCRCFHHKASAPLSAPGRLRYWQCCTVLVKVGQDADVRGTCWLR